MFFLFHKTVHKERRCVMANGSEAKSLHLLGQMHVTLKIVFIRTLSLSKYISLLLLDQIIIISHANTCITGLIFWIVVWNPNNSITNYKNSNQFIPDASNWWLIFIMIGRQEKGTKNTQLIIFMYIRSHSKPCSSRMSVCTFLS